VTELTPTERLHLALMLTLTFTTGINDAVGYPPLRDRSHIETASARGRTSERGSKVRHRSEDLHVEAPSLDGPDGRMAMPVETTVAVSCL
jgi:hypothetical protein